MVMAKKRGKFFVVRFDIVADLNGIQAIFAELFKYLKVGRHNPKMEGNVIEFGDEKLGGSIQGNESRDNQWVITIDCNNKLLTDRIYAHLDNKYGKKK